MYALTKIYKTKAMAVNAIRMTATNKGWKVLDTDSAETHVWPAPDGFTVNNVTLNAALGFVAEATEQVKGPALEATEQVKGPALEAVNVALAEQAGKDKQAPHLQAPSKLEQDKKENLAPKAKIKKATQEQMDHLFGKDKKVTEGDKKPTRCNVINNARRPLRGKTLLVWETTEMLAAGPNGCPTLKEVYEELCRLEPGFNKTTAGIQFYACRAYNGWESKK